VARIRLPIDARDLHELYSDAEAMRFLEAPSAIPRTLAESRAAALEVLRRIGFRIEDETEWEGRPTAFAVCERLSQPLEARA